MKTRNLTYLGGLAALAVAVGVLGARVDVDTSEVEAANSAMTLTINCTEGSASTWVPTGLTYTLTPLAADASTQPTDTSHAIVITTLSAPINSETVGTMVAAGAVGLGVNSSATKLDFYHGAPLMKLHGLACTTSTGATMAAVGSAADTTLDVSFVSSATTAYTSAKQVDIASPATNGIIFGPTTPYVGATLLDSADADGANGNVVFGGTDSDATFNIANQLTFLTDAVDSSAEVITFTLTAS